MKMLVVLAVVASSCVGESELVVLVDQTDPAIPVFDVDGESAITTILVARCVDENCAEPVWRINSSGSGHASDHPPTPVPVTYGVVPAAVYQGVYGSPPTALPLEAPVLTPGRFRVTVERRDIAFFWGDIGTGSAEFDVE